MLVRLDVIQAVRFAYHRRKMGVHGVAEQFELPRNLIAAICCLPDGTRLEWVQIRQEDFCETMSVAESIRCIRGEPGESNHAR